MTHELNDEQDNTPLDLEALSTLDFAPNWQQSAQQSESKGRKKREVRPQQKRKSSPRKSNVRREASRSPRERERVIAAPIEIKWVPDQKQVASLVKQIRQSKRAYPLIDTARILLKDPQSCRIKVEVKKEEESYTFYQCKQSGWLASTREAVEAHIQATQLALFYDEVQEERELPAGSFPGIYRCKKSGERIGPPNFHGFAEALEVWKERHFPQLETEAAKAHLELVRDEEEVEAWKKAYACEVRYVPKETDGAELLTRRQAELRIPLDEQIKRVKKASLAYGVAMQTSDRALRAAFERAFAKEKKFPLELSHSLRAALRHKKMTFFKVGKIHYVTAIKPQPLLSEEVVEEAQAIQALLQAHPALSRDQLVEKLEIDASDDEAVAHALHPLSWLVDRGHIIEFFNGMFSVPSK